SKKTTGYIGSSGRVCQAVTSAMTASVTELMNSGLTSVPYCSARNPWISRTVMPRAHGHDLVVEAREAALVLRDKQRLEAAFAVARHLDAYWPVLGEHGLAAHAVAMVARVLGLVLTGRIAQMVRELGTERPFNQRLLERHRGSID